jgi:hypothetical protein
VEVVQQRVVLTVDAKTSKLPLLALAWLYPAGLRKTGLDEVMLIRGYWLCVAAGTASLQAGKLARC